MAAYHNDNHNRKWMTEAQQHRHRHLIIRGRQGNCASCVCVVSDCLSSVCICAWSEDVNQWVYLVFMLILHRVTVIIVARIDNHPLAFPWSPLKAKPVAFHHSHFNHTQYQLPTGRVAMEEFKSHIYPWNQFKNIKMLSHRLATISYNDMLCL